MEVCGAPIEETDEPVDEPEALQGCICCAGEVGNYIKKARCQRRSEKQKTINMVDIKSRMQH